MSNFAMRTHPLRSPYDTDTPCHIGLTDSTAFLDANGEETRETVTVEGIPLITRDRTHFAREPRPQRTNDMVYYPSDQMSGIVKLKHTETPRTHRASEFQMRVAPRRDTEHSAWGAGQPPVDSLSPSGRSNTGGAGSDAGGDGYSKATGLFRSPEPELGKGHPDDMSYETGVANQTYRTVQTEFDRLTLGGQRAQGKTAGSDGRYIKEGHYGHSLELMHPEGAAAADAMSPTHTRVVWNAPGQTNEIEAPFAYDDTGHIGLAGLPGSTHGRRADRDSGSADRDSGSQRQQRQAAASAASAASAANHSRSVEAQMFEQQQRLQYTRPASAHKDGGALAVGSSPTHSVPKLGLSSLSAGGTRNY